VDQTASRLTQEFVRVRNRSEDEREAIVTAICVRSASSHTIVFCDTKKMAHRMVIILGMCGLQAAELHGNLTQKQRLESLEMFKRGETKILVATDLASRGLDVPGVDTVINMFMPRRVERYIHRVGRTFRCWIFLSLSLFLSLFLSLSHITTTTTTLTHFLRYCTCRTQRKSNHTCR
jgi:ATP-dependent RNA helicase DDX27